MQLSRKFDRVIFPTKVIDAAVQKLKQLVVNSDLPDISDLTRFSISRGTEVWTLYDLDEWYGEYSREHEQASLSIDWRLYALDIEQWSDSTNVTVTAPSRSEVESTMQIFSFAAEANTIQMPDIGVIEDLQPPIVVFIGHGHSSDWRKVKDQLQDSHGYKVEAYEVGERAGHSIRDVLDSMLDRSSFALLMMTAEDESANGEVRARQNVVHEAGLFQGRLGFNRAIAVVEEGVEVFSNLSGVDQIRYPKGHVDVAIARILATLRREFGDRR